MSEEIIISVEDVFLSYEKLFSSLKPEHSLPLKGISFKIYKGECLGVLGRNGAGKSTLLKLLAGILVPDKGKIVNQGHSVSLLTIQAGFAPLLTGRENAILGGIIMGKNKKTMESIVEEIKEYSGLGDFFEKMISKYSSGMRARLGFSVAMHLNPDIVLIDETLGVGDYEFRKKSDLAVREKLKNGRTAVLVSHSLGLVKELCSRCIVIKDGVCLYEGECTEGIRVYQESYKLKE